MTMDSEAIETRAREMLCELVGNHYSGTTLRVATDWLKRERRLANPTPPEGDAK